MLFILLLPEIKISLLKLSFNYILLILLYLIALLRLILS